MARLLSTLNRFFYSSQHQAETFPQRRFFVGKYCTVTFITLKFSSSEPSLPRSRKKLSWITIF